MARIVHLLPAIDSAIWNAAGAAAPRPPAKAEQGRHHNNVKVPDETILEMRRMHEVERKTIRQIMRAFPEMNERYVRNVLEYIIRSNLKVKGAK